MPAGPCWYLKGTGVDPSAQRTGLRSALINQMLPRIEDEALPAFLDTSTRATMRGTRRGGAVTDCCG